jgi:uncharacterized protein (UPF0261 family)
MPNQPFWMPEADQALVSNLLASLRTEVEIIELNTDINDPRCAEAAAQALLGLLKIENQSYTASERTGLG